MALEIRALCLFAWLSETVFESEDLFVFTLLAASARALHIDGVVGLRLGDLELSILAETGNFCLISSTKMPVVGAELYVFSLYKLWMGVPLKTQRMEGSALYYSILHSFCLRAASVNICSR